MKNSINFILNFEQTLLANSGDDAFEIALYLISLKLLDEVELKEGKQNSDFFDNQNIQSALDNLYLLEERASLRWADLLIDRKLFNISDEHLYRVMKSLSKINIIHTDLNIIDALLETLVSQSSKSSFGQYFTPREIVKLCVDIINPKAHETILDPACGSSAFLFESTVKHLANETKSPLCLGLDISSKSIRVAYLIKLAKSLDNIELIQTNSLDSTHVTNNFEKLDKDIWCKNHEGTITLDNINSDVVFANPPYAGTLEGDLLKQYELAKNKHSVSREVLFIERCIKFLKENGRLAIIIPKGILSNISYKYVRDWLISNVRITAVIGLEKNAFMPYTSVQTSILFLENKKPKKNDSIIFSCSFNSGHDSSSRNVSKSDYAELSETIVNQLNNKNAGSHPFKKIKLQQVVESDRLDAEFYISGATDNLAKLSEISDSKIRDLVNGTHKKFNKKLYNSVRYVDISSVETKFGYVFPNKFDMHELPGRASYLLKKGDVLISTVRPERNTVALIESELDENMVASNGFCVLRPEHINPYYLYAYCKSDLFKNILSGLSTSSMYPTVSDKDILDIPIIYPDPLTKSVIEEKVATSFQKITQAQNEIKEAIEMMNHYLNDTVK